MGPTERMRKRIMKNTDNTKPMTYIEAAQKPIAAIVRATLRPADPRGKMGFPCFSGSFSFGLAGLKNYIPARAAIIIPQAKGR